MHVDLLVDLPYALSRFRSKVRSMSRPPGLRTFPAAPIGLMSQSRTPRPATRVSRAKGITEILVCCSLISGLILKFLSNMLSQNNMTNTAEASTSDISPSPSGAATPFVSAHGTDILESSGGTSRNADQHVKVDISLEDTQHTATAHTTSASASSVPAQSPKTTAQPSRSQSEKHNRTTIKRNNVAPEPPHPHHHHKRTASVDSGGGILLNSSTRALRGSTRGDARSSLTFGNLPRSIEVGRGGDDNDDGINENDEYVDEDTGEHNTDGKDGEVDPDGAATWGDVAHSCCCHTPKEWGQILVAVAALLTCLYFFLVGLDLMGVSFQVVGGCTAGSILGEDTNPIASLMIGIIATAILQSSSTTTAIIVSLVSGGLDIRQAIYMVMGANVGTAITAIIVTLGHLGDGDELEKAFAGAVINFVFKILVVVILLPLEVATGYLYYLTKAMLPESVGDGEKWEGPIKKIVSPLSRKIIIANKKVIEEIAGGEVESCDEYYPVTCAGGVISYETCDQGLIGCDKKTGKCPAFFRDGSTKSDDMISGGVMLFLALIILILCLLGLVALLRKMLLGASTRIIYKATSINEYLALLIGMGVTVLVQSSSITTSTLVPLAGIGVLKLEQMYPLTIGADIGTTFTALMAAMVSTKVEALQVALVHLFFNVTGFLMYYPIPFMRRIPLGMARKLGKATRMWRTFPIVFVVVAFLLVPLLLFGLSTLFEQSAIGWVVLGSFLVIGMGLGLIYFIFWWKFRDGGRKMAACFARRNRRSAAQKNLPDDMDYLKADMEFVKSEIVNLKEFAGIVEAGLLRPQHRRDYDRQDTFGTLDSLITAEDVSLYQTCREKNWADVINMGASTSHRSLGDTLASHQRYWGEL